MRESMSVPVWMCALVVLAGCAAPGGTDAQPRGPDAPDLEVGTTSGHPHGSATAEPYCGGYTLGVGNDRRMLPAMHDAPADVVVSTREDPEQEWLPLSLPHPNGSVSGAWVHYAYYRSFGENGSVERGFSLAATDPPTLSLLGSWPVQDDPPFEVVKLLDRVVVSSEGASEVLWRAWLDVQENGTGDGHMLYGGELRVPTAWQQLFGGHSMPPRRGEGELFPAGRALLESQGWVWSVTAPWTTWRNDTVTVHADAFGRFTVMVPEYRAKAALESALIEWRLPVPEQMFVSLQDGKPGG